MNTTDGCDLTLGPWLEGSGPREGDRGVRDGCRVVRVRARYALSPSGLGGFDWALNPYVGCGHGCVYCYAPSVLGLERGTWGATVKARQNVPSLLARELLRRERGVVGLATVTDPYQPAERDHRLTRRCLRHLADHDWPVCVLTKSDLVVRDLDILEALPECEVGLTITTLDDHQRRLLEPGATPVARRLAALRLLSGSGVRTYAFLGPIYPTATEGELREMLRQVRSAGASHVLVDRLNLKRGVWLAVARALSGDSDLLELARSRLFPEGGGEDFYVRAMAVLEQEAAALGIPLHRA